MVKIDVLKKKWVEENIRKPPGFSPMTFIIENYYDMVEYI